MIDGKKIRRVRRNLDITQKELAKRVGITQQYLMMIEKYKSNPSIKIVESIAKELVLNVQDSLVAELRDPQRESNLRRSKALHMLNNNQAIYEEGAIDNVICEIMHHDGPDRHVDGHEVITDFIMALLNGQGEEWEEKYAQGHDGL